MFCPAINPCCIKHHPPGISVKKLPSYVQDTKDTLKVLAEVEVPPGSLLVGIEVESLLKVDPPPATDVLDKLSSPRVIKTHLQADVLPKSFWEKNCKVIYVARNAKDVAVSYYHFYRMAYGHPEPGTWDEFLNSYMEGNVAFGSWAKHVKGWWKRRTPGRMLYLFYEDMLLDPRGEIEKVMKFMEKDLPIEVVEKINKNTTFKAMKDNPMTNYSTFPFMDHTISPFMRKGISGDWKNQFTVAQNERFKDYYRKEMSDTDLTFRM